VYRVYAEFADGRERQCWLVTDSPMDAAQFAINMARSVTDQVTAIYDEED
jgi:hypothetical protein